MSYIFVNPDKLHFPRIDIAKVEIKLFKKKWYNYCLFCFLYYKRKWCPLSMKLGLRYRKFIINNCKNR